LFIIDHWYLRAEKGECHLYKADVYAHAKGMKFIVVPPDSLKASLNFDPSFEIVLKEYREAFGENLYIAATRRYHGDDNKYLYRLSQLSSKLNIPLVATNDVHYHIPKRRQLQDILPASVKSVRSIMPVIVCIQMQNDI
jgi:error-prone DNA polymerase